MESTSELSRARTLTRKKPESGAHALTRMTVASSYKIYDGYGSMAEYLVLGLARAGVAVNVSPIGLDRAGLSDEFIDLLDRSMPDPVDPALYFYGVTFDLDQFLSSRDLFIYTMWDSSELPGYWPDLLNQARAVIVPTRFCARVCRASGVVVPIEVVPLGVDPAIYFYRERPNRPGLTTLIVSTLIARKHVPEAVAGWQQAFAGDPDARLIIKARFQYGNYVPPDDPRISIVDDDEPTRGIAHWYERADVLLALGSEGFGLPLIEGMATGLPVIALDSEGQSDVCADAPDCLLPVPAVRYDAYSTPFGDWGVCGVPGVDDVADRLRWVSTHRQEAGELGRRASAWTLKHRDAWAIGPSVLAAMRRWCRTSDE